MIRVSPIVLPRATRKFRDMDPVGTFTLRLVTRHRKYVLLRREELQMIVVDHMYENLWLRSHAHLTTIRMTSFTHVKLWKLTAAVGVQAGMSFDICSFNCIF